MNSKQRQKKFSRNISIVLAVLIVATLCVTIAALTASHRKKTEGDHNASSDISTLTMEPTSRPTEPTQSPTEAAPTPTTEPGPKPSDPAVSVIEWTSPAAGNIIKEYSADVPVFSLTMEDYRVHTGVDIEGDAGDDVLAAADGVIESVYYDPMMGQTVVIAHSGGYKTIYQNMQTAIPDTVTTGASVKKGDKIGAMGDTALIEISESPHLHFSVIVDGKYSDPLSYITVSASAGSTWYED